MRVSKANSYAVGICSVDLTFLMRPEDRDACPELLLVIPVLHGVVKTREARLALYSS